MIEATYIFKGVVQGVGFRFVTTQFANELDLKGSVTNLTDGSVEVSVQGSPKVIDRLLERLKNHFGAKIQDVVLIDQKKPAHLLEHFIILG